MENGEEAAESSGDYVLLGVDENGGDSFPGTCTILPVLRVVRAPGSVTSLSNLNPPSPCSRPARPSVAPQLEADSGRQHFDSKDA